jgi:type IV pilus assembly protein PilC
MAATRTAVRKTVKKTVPLPETTLKVFTWEGLDKRGIKMKGEEAAHSEHTLMLALRKRGITNPVVRAARKPLFGAAGKKITAQEIAVFARQLATMMQSGIPMVQAFGIVAGGQKNIRMKNLLESIGADVAGGSSLSEALGKHPQYFDKLFQNLVYAGENAGVLDTVLDTLATYKENIETLKGKIKKALFYPAAVIAVAIIVSAILLIFVVPQFKSLFEGFGADLPAFTQLIVKMSEFAVSWWWLMALIAFAAAFIMANLYKRSRTFVEFVDRMMLKIPVVGQILHNSAIARFSRTLAVTFKAGVPLVEALETVAGATGNIIYEKAVLRIRDDVASGYPVNVAMKQVNLFPHMVVQMTAIGEEAGALDTMLYKVAEFYEQEVNNAVDTLSSLIEPFIMVIIGGMVGSMVIGMYLPIFKLAAAI